LSLSEVCWRSAYPSRVSRITFLKRSLPGFPGGTLFSAAVMRCCSRKRSSERELNFFDNHSWQPERVQTQCWVEDGVNAGIVEKICLSSEERLFRISPVISGAEENSGNRPQSIEAKGPGYSHSMVLGGFELIS
jgi:hypothetical protein